jgi:apolipoprotein N-acyltransferase
MKKNVGLSLLVGILFALALPPFKTGFFAYIALIPFFLLLENKQAGEAFRWGYITGLFIAITTLFWIGWVTVPGLLGVLLIWPLYIALFAVVHTFLLRQFSVFAYALAPFFWVSIEYLQSLSEFAFPWNYIGYTQSYYLPLIQYAEFTSVFGVSFWVVLINVLLLTLWKNFNKDWRIVASASLLLMLLFIGPLAFGFYTMSADENVGESIKISLVQGNRDPNAKWDGDIYEDNFKIYDELTRKVSVEKPDLIIWPETALPFYLRSKPQYKKRIHALVDSFDADLLTGIMDFVYFKDGSYDNFNSAMLFEAGKHQTQAYAKMKLVPFSERVPYKNYFPFMYLKKLLWDLGIGDFGVGDNVTSFSGQISNNEQDTQDGGKVSTYKTGTAICFESVFPDHVRKYVNEKANFLIIITNDAWFGKTSAPFQHTQIAVFRAIENRREIARCANTGISCFIDKFGRVRKATSIFTQDIVTDSVSLNSEYTFYTQYGNIFVIFITISSLLFLIIAVTKKLLF